jgi:hypothetical protein
VRQIVYFSTAVGRQDAITMASVVAVSRDRNQRDQVSGLLIAGGDRFLGVIEGPTSVVGATMKRIRRDHRHLGVMVLVKRRIEARSFSDWSMVVCDQLPPGEFVTLATMVKQLQRQVGDSPLRAEIDCFARSFVMAPYTPAPMPSPWTRASGYDAPLSLDRGH